MSIAEKDYKQAAVDCWTHDPCGPRVGDAPPGSKAYFDELTRRRFEYGPWFPEVLEYSETRGLHVLDVGCGQGIDLAQYALAGADATGIDLTPRHVELARAHVAALGLEARVVQGDAEALPFPDRSFDRVSSNGVLHHTPDMAAAVREIHRVLRPGGEARIIVYNGRSFHYWLSQVLYHGLVQGRLFREGSMASVLSGGVEYTRIGGRPLVRVYSRPQLRKMMENAGFAAVKLESRHFRLTDTPITYPVRNVQLLQNPRLLDRIGRVGGWYLIARGRRA